jgi:hypothetical protein
MRARFQQKYDFIENLTPKFEFKFDTIFLKYIVQIIIFFKNIPILPPNDKNESHSSPKL